MQCLLSDPSVMFASNLRFPHAQLMDFGIRKHTRFISQLNADIFFPSIFCNSCLFIQFHQRPPYLLETTSLDDQHK